MYIPRKVCFYRLQESSMTLVSYGSKVKVKRFNKAALCLFSPEALVSNIMNIPTFGLICRN